MVINTVHAANRPNLSLSCLTWPYLLKILQSVCLDSQATKQLRFLQIQVGHAMIEHKRPALMDSFFQVRKGPASHVEQIMQSD